MQVNTGNDKSTGSDHLVKLGEDVFLLESEEPVKHDPDQPDVSLGTWFIMFYLC
jgi:hypothetical protein